MDRKAWITGGILLAIIALAAWFRFYDVQHYPPGLFPTQAANGEDARLILGGDMRPFYPRDNGREALFFYVQALLLKIFGVGVWPLFAASALVGTATVAVMFFAVRPWFGRLAGLLGAYFLATSHWHITLSRAGFQAIMVPLFIALFTALVGYTIRAIKTDRRQRSYLYAALVGVVFAGGFYTYIVYRVMIGVVLGIALLILVDDWIVEFRRHLSLHARDLPHVMRYWPHVLIALLTAVLTCLPLGWYFMQHPADFVGRAGHVSIFNPALQREFGGGTFLGTFLYSLRETLMSFFAGEGDMQWQHTVAGFPLLNPLVGILLLLGGAWAIHGTVSVFYAIVRGREVHMGMIYPYVLLLLVGMLLPVIMTAESMPHGLRSVGLMVPIFMLAGTAGSVGLYWLRRRVGSEWGQTVIAGVVSGLLVLMAVYAGALYFLIARHDPEAYRAYRGDLPVVAAYIQAYVLEHPRGEDDLRPYVVLDDFSLQSVHFLTAVAAHDHVVGDASHPDEAQHLWRQLEPATSHLTPLRPGEVIIFTQSTMPDADQYLRQHPEVKLREQRYNQFGQEIMRVYELPVGLETPAGEASPALDA